MFLRLRRLQSCLQLLQALIDLFLTLGQFLQPVEHLPLFLLRRILLSLRLAGHLITIFLPGQVHLIQLHLPLLFRSRSRLALTPAPRNPDLPCPHGQQGLIGFLFCSQGGRERRGLFFHSAQLFCGLLHGFLRGFPAGGHAWILTSFGGGPGGLGQGICLGIAHHSDIGGRRGSGALQLPCGIDDLLLKFGQLRRLLTGTTGPGWRRSFASRSFLALTEDFIKGPDFAEEEIGLGAAGFSVRADVVRPDKPRNQIIRLRALFLQAQQVLE